MSAIGSIHLYASLDLPTSGFLPDIFGKDPQRWIPAYCEVMRATYEEVSGHALCNISGQVTSILGKPSWASIVEKVVPYFEKLGKTKGSTKKDFGAFVWGKFNEACPLTKAKCQNQFVSFLRDVVSCPVAVPAALPLPNIPKGKKTK